MRTDRTAANNKPDITIRNKNNEGSCMLIDAAIHGDRNVIKKEAEKILKYKDLLIEIQRMWIVIAKVIPVIIGATGTISKSLRKYLSDIPRKLEIKEQKKKKKTSHFGRCKHTAESANVKVQNIFHVRNNITCSINGKYRTAATLCT